MNSARSNPPVSLDVRFRLFDLHVQRVELITYMAWPHSGLLAFSMRKPKQQVDPSPA
jgi:hypothetical protein